MGCLGNAYRTHTGVVGSQEKDETIDAINEDEGVLRKIREARYNSATLWMWYFITSSAIKDELSRVLGAFNRDSG